MQSLPLLPHYFLRICTYACTSMYISMHAISYDVVTTRSQPLGSRLSAFAGHGSSLSISARLCLQVYSVVVKQC